MKASDQVVIIIGIVIAVAIIAYFGLTAKPQTDNTILSVNTISGFKLAENALELVQKDLKTPSGGYEHFIAYDGSREVLRSSSDTDNKLLDQVDQDMFLRNMLYLACWELSKTPEGIKYKNNADGEFKILYETCKSRNLCNGMAYWSVYREWQDTGNQEYKNLLPSTAVRLYNPNDPSIPFSLAAQALGFAFSIDHKDQTANMADDQFILANDKLSQLSSVTPEWFAQKCQVQRAKGSLLVFGLASLDESILSTHKIMKERLADGTINFEIDTLVSCGHALIDAYKLTGNNAYKVASEEILAIIANDYKNFKNYRDANNKTISVGSIMATNAHYTASVLEAAIFAARLYDSEVVLR